MRETRQPPASLLPSPNSFPSTSAASKGSLLYCVFGLTVSWCEFRRSTGFSGSKCLFRAYTLFPARCPWIFFSAKNFPSTEAVLSSSLLKEGVATSCFSNASASCFSMSLTLFIYDAGTPCATDQFRKMFCFSDHHSFNTCIQCSESIIEFWYHAGEYFIFSFKTDT